MNLTDLSLEQWLVFDLKTFISILMIDLVLSGDNAIIIGMAASGLDSKQKKKAILIGIVVATILRVIFASFAYLLLQITGLTLVGGLLLLWVTYKTWREIQRARQPSNEADKQGQPIKRSFRSALLTIVIADVTMSLDNVLAVAGASHGYPGMLVFGLLLSIALMAFAANLIAGLLQRYHWIAYIGTAIVGYVAIDMIWRGGSEVVQILPF